MTANRVPSRSVSSAAPVACCAALIFADGKIIEPDASTMMISAATPASPAAAGRRDGDDGVDLGAAERQELVLVALGGEARHGPALLSGSTSMTATVMSSRPPRAMAVSARRRATAAGAGSALQARERRRQVMRLGRVVPEPVRAQDQPPGRAGVEGEHLRLVVGRVRADPAGEGMGRAGRRRPRRR